MRTPGNPRERGEKFHPETPGVKVIGWLASLVSWHDSNAVLYREIQRVHISYSLHTDGHKNITRD